MRPGPQHVLRGFAKRVVALSLALAALMLAGATAGAGVAAGFLLAMALAVHAAAFGVAATLRAAPPVALRIGAVVAIGVAGAAGVWAARGDAFAFMAFNGISPGGAAMHAAAALAIAGACSFVFLAIAGRASALGGDDA